MLRYVLCSHNAEFSFARDGDLKEVELLVTHGADVNAKGLGEMTPLHWAVNSCSVEMVEFLLKCPGIDLSGQDDEGRTPLEYAYEKFESTESDVLEGCPHCEMIISGGNKCGCTSSKYCELKRDLSRLTIIKRRLREAEQAQDAEECDDKMQE